MSRLDEILTFFTHTILQISRVIYKKTVINTPIYNMYMMYKMRINNSKRASICRANWIASSVKSIYCRSEFSWKQLYWQFPGWSMGKNSKFRLAVGGILLQQHLLLLCVASLHLPTLKLRCNHFNSNQDTVAHNWTHAEGLLIASLNIIFISTWTIHIWTILHTITLNTV